MGKECAKPSNVHSLENKNEYPFTCECGWNRLQPEKAENKTRSNKRILEPLGLGRLYTLDIASADELASIARYSAKVEYVTKPVKVPEGKLPEVSGFLAGGYDHGKERSGHGRHLPRLARPFGDWMRNGPERRYA